MSDEPLGLDFPRLNPREREVLRMLAEEGLTNREIAQRMALSVKQIEAMLGTSDPFRSIYSKIGVINRAQAVAWYYHDKVKSSTDELEARWNESPGKIYEIRTRGHPQLALAWCQQDIAKLRNFMQRVPLTAAQRGFYSHLLASILYEEQAVLKEIVPRSGLYPVVEPIIKEISGLGDRQDDHSIVGLASLALGDTYYLLMEYSVSIGFLTRARELISQDDTQLLILRDLALAYGYSDEAVQFRRTESDIRKTIERGHWNKVTRVCTCLEGLARAQGILGMEDALQTLEESRRLYDRTSLENRAAVVRAIQLSRSEVELSSLLGSSRSEVEATAIQGINLARQYGYESRALLLEQMIAGLP